jgi:hypothetical protein
MLNVDGLEIQDSDLLDEMINYYDFKMPEAQTSDGWRLPTRAELLLMYEQHQANQDGFHSERYMSSEIIPERYRNWAIDFSNGSAVDVDITESHWGLCWIRLVRGTAE